MNLSHFERLFEAASDDPDMEYVMIDATIVPVHRHVLPGRRMLAFAERTHGAKALSVIASNHLSCDRGLEIRQSVNRKAGGQQKSSL